MRVSRLLQFVSSAECATVVHRCHGDGILPNCSSRRIQLALTAVSGALAAKAAVIYIKGERMEYVTTQTFPSWTHNVHPCPTCFCSPDTMHDLKNFTLESVGWELKTIDPKQRGVRASGDPRGR